MPAGSIQYLKHHEIDRMRWDHCIEHASNGLIFARHFYLNYMAVEWDALVLGDYEAVMPLTWRKKWGIYYLYQPFNTLHLGVMGKDPDPALVHRFLTAIPARFRFWEINLNPGNQIQGILHKRCKMRMRANYTISLEEEYSVIESRYRNNLKRNLKKAAALGLVIKRGIPLEEVLDLAVQQLDQYTKYSQADLSQFKQLSELLLGNQEALTYGIYLRDQLLSSAIFFFSGNQAYYILVGNHPNGRTLSASHLLVDRFIYDHSETGLLLNFTGSDQKSIAFFYENFGAKVEHYPHLRLNNLPYLLRWMKD